MPGNCIFMKSSTCIFDLKKCCKTIVFACEFICCLFLYCLWFFFAKIWKSRIQYIKYINENFKKHSIQKIVRNYKRNQSKNLICFYK